MSNFMTTGTELNGILNQMKSLESDAAIKLANVCRVKGEEGIKTSSLASQIEELLRNCSNEQKVSILTKALAELSAGLSKSSSGRNTNMFDELVDVDDQHGRRNKKIKDRKGLW